MSNLVAELRAEHARAKEPLQFKWPTRELFKRAADEIERLTAEAGMWQRRSANYAAMEAECDRLRAVLELAVRLLKQSFADESVWEMYWAKSKEAAPLREALAGAKGAHDGWCHDKDCDHSM